MDIFLNLFYILLQKDVYLVIVLNITDIFILSVRNEETTIPD